MQEITMKNQDDVWRSYLASTSSGKIQSHMPDVIALQENFLEVAVNNYYYPVGVDSYEGAPRTYQDEIDMVKILYDKDHLNQLDGWESSNNTNTK